MTSALNKLRTVELFSELSDTTLRRIAAASVLQTYPPEEHIIMEDEPCRAVYFIIEGGVRIYRVSREGREQVLVRLGPGQAFNTVPAFQDDGRNPANAVTLSDVELCVLIKDDFLRLVGSHGDLAMAILGDFADRLDHLTDLVEGLALHTVQGRLARFLLDHVESAEERETRGVSKPESRTPPSMKLRWTQQEIATYLGTVRDMVGRGLRAFQDQGLIRVSRSRIILLDREGLEAVAQE